MYRCTWTYFLCDINIIFFLSNSVWYQMYWIESAFAVYTSVWSYRSNIDTWWLRFEVQGLGFKVQRNKMQWFHFCYSVLRNIHVSFPAAILWSQEESLLSWVMKKVCNYFISVLMWTFLCQCDVRWVTIVELFFSYFEVLLVNFKYHHIQFRHWPILTQQTNHFSTMTCWI